MSTRYIGGALIASAATVASVLVATPPATATTHVNIPAASSTAVYQVSSLPTMRLAPEVLGTLARPSTGLGQQVSAPVWTAPVTRAKPATALPRAQARHAAAAGHVTQTTRPTSEELVGGGIGALVGAPIGGLVMGPAGSLAGTITGMTLGCVIGLPLLIIGCIPGAVLGGAIGATAGGIGGIATGAIVGGLGGAAIGSGIAGMNGRNAVAPAQRAPVQKPGPRHLAVGHKVITHTQTKAGAAVPRHRAVSPRVQPAPQVGISLPRELADLLKLAPAPTHR